MYKKYSTQRETIDAYRDTIATANQNIGWPQLCAICCSVDSTQRFSASEIVGNDLGGFTTVGLCRSLRGTSGGGLLTSRELLLVLLRAAPPAAEELSDCVRCFLGGIGGGPFDSRGDGPPENDAAWLTDCDVRVARDDGLFS